MKENIIKNLNDVPSGINFPEDLYVIIEIAYNSYPIKYEMNKNFNVLFVDRFIQTPMFYPCNYGYINNTLTKDGDPIDVLIPTPYPLMPGSIIYSRPIGVLNMIDESGEDLKIIAVPHNSLSNIYDNILDIENLSINLKEQIVHFFKHYKDNEKGKWTKINGWDNIECAKKMLLSYKIK